MSGRGGLEGLARWVTRPVGLGNGVGLTLALLHASLTRLPPEGTGRLFLGLVATACVLQALLSTLQRRHALRVLRGVEAGRLPAVPDNLRQALREVRSIPGRCFAYTLQGWLLGALLVAVAFPPLVEARAGTGIRIALGGLSLGALSALLAYMLVVRRSRRAAERIAAQGLSPLDVIAAIPQGRQRLRQRLVVFTAVAVFCPSAFILDMSMSRTVRVFDQMLATQGAQAQVDSDALEQDSSSRERAQLAFAGLVLLVVLGTAWAGGTALDEPLRALTEDATRLAGGELRTPRLIPAEDEVWTVSAALLRMQVHLSQALTQLRRAGLEISSTTEQLVNTMAEQEEGAAEQVASLSETRSTTGDLARSAQQIAEKAESVSSMAEASFASAQKGQRSAAAFLYAMHRMKQDNQAIADAVVRLDKRVQQIGKVVEFINEIADKADLLALNAELEGTNAGEVGRGFSLVAAEMRRLAENVLKSTLAIERLIDEIRDATQAAVMATEAGLKTTEGGAGLASQVEQSLSLILELARQTTQAVRSISLATQQQKSSTDLLAEVMADILRTTEQNTVATQEMLGANRDLSSLSRDLKAVVQRFRLEETGG